MKMQEPNERLASDLTLSEFQNLPADMKWQILLELDLKSLNGICRTDRAFRELCQTDLFWRAKLDRDFPDRKKRQVSEGSPREMYLSQVESAAVKAIQAGDFKTLEEWIDWGAGIRRGAMSMFMITAINNNRSLLLPLLMSIGDDINESYFGQTPLMVAAKRNDVYAAEFLIENGADPNIPNPSGRTALGYAIINRAKEVQSLLESLGADYGDPKTYLVRTRLLDFDE
jgi:hypothetical protein